MTSRATSGARAVGSTLRRRDTKLQRTLFIAGLALLGVVLFLAPPRILQAIGDHLVVQDDLQPADLILVLAGPGYRTDHAIQLYHQGYGARLFFTSGSRPAVWGDHGERARARSLRQGVPAEAIVTDTGQVTSTYAEMVRLQEFIAQSPEPIRSVIVVSDPFHMRRAQWSARRVLGSDVRVQMAPVPFEMTPYERRWWADEASRHYVWDEYGKAAYYIARYQIGFKPLSEWLASFDRE